MFKIIKMSYQVMPSGNVPLEQVSKEQLCVVITQQGIRVSQLEAENAILKARNRELEDDNKMLRGVIMKNELIIAKNETEIAELKRKNVELTEQVQKLTDRVNELIKHVNACENDKKFQSAVLRLHQCHDLVSKAFEESYREFFNIEYDPVPTIGRFLRNPPTESNKNYDFWQSFLKRYPGTDDKGYQSIYEELNNMRMPIAHPDIRKMKEDDFDTDVKMVFPDYGDHGRYKGYRKWLYLF